MSKISPVSVCASKKILQAHKSITQTRTLKCFFVFFLAFELFEDFILGHTHSMSILMRAQLACSRVYVCVRILQCVTNLCVCVCFISIRLPTAASLPGRHAPSTAICWRRKMTKDQILRLGLYKCFH